MRTNLDSIKRTRTCVESPPIKFRISLPRNKKKKEKLERLNIEKMPIGVDLYAAYPYRSFSTNTGTIHNQRGGLLLERTIEREKVDEGNGENGTVEVGEVEAEQMDCLKCPLVFRK